MNLRYLAIASLAMVLAGASIGALAQSLSPELQALDEQLPGELINDPTTIDWSGYGANYKSDGVQDPSIPGGGAARRFTIEAKGANPYDVATNIPILADVSRGEQITVGFYARTISAETPDGLGTIGVRFQQNAAPYGGFGDTTIKPTREWKWHEVSAVADKRIRRADAIVALQLAGAKQTIEIGQAIVVRGAPSIIVTTTTVTKPAEPVLPPPLEGAGVLLNDPVARGWSSFGSPGSWLERDEPRIWLGKATRFTTTAVGANPWDVGTSITIPEAIAEGDKILIAIAARTESAVTADGKALVGVRIQDSAPPYTGFAENNFSVGPNWQLIRIRTTAPRAFAPGSAQLALHFAGTVQSVDIGPVYILKTP